MNKENWINAAIERYENTLLKYSYSIVRDLDLARDVVQETFMRLSKQEQEKIDHYLSQWLFKVCRNCSLKVLKKEKMYILDEDLDSYAAPEDISNEPQLENFYTIVLNQLNMLSHKKQLVIKKRYFENLSYSQIAEQLKLTKSNVGFIIHDALKQMKKHLCKSTEMKSFAACVI
jgi:RNA polymerase sigma factor (sigma-70 family)